MAGHIGLELRCAGGKFISLRNRRSSEMLQGRPTCRFKEHNLLGRRDCSLPASTIVQPRRPALRPQAFPHLSFIDMIPIVEPAVHSVSLNRWMVDAFRACMAPSSGGTRALFYRRHTLRVRLGRCRRDLCGCYGRAGTADPRGPLHIVDRAACDWRDAMVVVPEELRRWSADV